MKENYLKMRDVLKSDDFQIIMRNIEIKDAEFLMELNNDMEIAHFVVGSPRIVNFQEQMQWMNNLKYEKNCKRFIIEYNCLPVGTIIISNIDTVNLTANISIKLCKSAQGKGIGKKSINMIVEYCFETLNLKCLTANILVYNAASLALFRSCGFVEEGILRSRVIKEDKRCDLISFSRLKNDNFSA